MGLYCCGPVEWGLKWFQFGTQQLGDHNLAISAQLLLTLTKVPEICKRPGPRQYISGTPPINWEWFGENGMPSAVINFTYPYEVNTKGYYLNFTANPIEIVGFGVLFVLWQELSLYYHTCSACVVARVWMCGKRVPQKVLLQEQTM